MWSVGGPKSVHGCNPNSFFLRIDYFNRIQTEKRVKRNIVAIVVWLSLMVVAVYFNERETFSTRDVAV